MSIIPPGAVAKNEVRLSIPKKVDIKYESKKLKAIINTTIAIPGIITFFNILISSERNFEPMKVPVAI